MVTLLVQLVLAVLPFLVVVGLLNLAAWRDRTRRAAVERQIALTDAIARELGAVVAPVVTKPLLGPWRIEIAVPLSRSGTVARVLAIVHRALALAHLIPGRYRIILTPQEEFVVPIAAARPKAA